MEKVILTKLKKDFGVVVFVAKEIEPSYGGYYSVWYGTECIDFGLCLDAAIDIFKRF